MRKLPFLPALLIFVGITLALLFPQKTYAAACPVFEHDPPVITQDTPSVTFKIGGGGQSKLTGDWEVIAQCDKATILKLGYDFAQTVRGTGENFVTATFINTGGQGCIFGSTNPKVLLRESGKKDFLCTAAYDTARSGRQCQLIPRVFNKETEDVLRIDTDTKIVLTGSGVPPQANQVSIQAEGATPQSLPLVWVDKAKGIFRTQPFTLDSQDIPYRITVGTQTQVFGIIKECGGVSLTAGPPGDPRENKVGAEGSEIFVSGPEFCKGDSGIETAIGCIPIDNENAFVSWVLGWAIGIAGGIAFLLIIFASFQIMTASGNPDRLQSGRELLTAAISGLILIVFSVFLLRLIGVEILSIPGL